MSEINHEDRLQHIIEIERELGEIQDVDVLLERILTETRRIVNADAGSIYVVEGDKLKIKYGQNDTHLKELAPGEKLPYTSFSFPINEKQICGYVALSGTPLNIKDCYTIPETKPYKFNNGKMRSGIFDFAERPLRSAEQNQKSRGSIFPSYKFNFYSSLFAALSEW